VQRFFWGALPALGMAMGFPPLSLWPLCWISFVWLGFEWLRCERPHQGAWLLGGYTFFVNVFGFYWLIFTLKEFGGMPWILAGVVFLLGSALLSLPAAAVGAVFVRLHNQVRSRFQRTRLSLWMGACLGVSFLLLDLFEPRLFAWSAVHGAGANRELLASVGLVSLWGWRLVFFGSVALAAGFWVWGSRWRFVWTAAIFLIPHGVLYTAGRYQILKLKEQFPELQPVALLQGNVGNYEKKLTKQGVMPTVRNVMDIHQTMVESVAIAMSREKTPLEPWVAWPETSFPGFPLTDFSLRQELESMLRLTGGVHLVGAYEMARAPFAGSEKELDFNIVAFLHETEPRRIDHYRKRIRLPFGEYIPFDEQFPFLYEWLPAVNHFGAGERFHGLAHPNPEGPVFVPLVCYEILSRSFVRSFVRHLKAEYPDRPLVLVNPTNDSWYGPTAEPFQHSLIARWMVAELGLPTLRPTNTGLSQVIAPWGEVVATTHRDETRVVYGLLPVRRAMLRTGCEVSGCP
jgi:apolipoprotein N-acyltransferase